MSSFAIALTEKVSPLLFGADFHPVVTIGPGSVGSEETDLLDQDGALAEAIEWELRRSGHLALRNITVCPRNGIVILRGHVPSYYQKQLAQAIAQRTPAVRGVINELAVH